MLSLLINQLHHVIPFFVLISFILYTIIIYLNRASIKKFLLKIDRKTWYVLLLIFVIALLIRVLIPAHAHIDIYEEFKNMQAARNMLQTGSQGSYTDPMGWPFILSMAFAIFGLSNWVAIYTCLVLGALTVFPLFFLAFIITRRNDLALIPPLLLSVYAPHIRWSTTAKSNVPSLFFVLLSLFFFFIYYKNRSNSSLWLVFLSLAFAAQIRMENYMLPLLFFIGCFIYIKPFFKKIKKFILPGLVLILLSSPNLVTFIGRNAFTNYLEEVDDMGHPCLSCPKKNNGGFDNLLFNSTNFGIYIFNSALQPIAFSFLFLAGFVYMLKKQRKGAFFLLAWFSCMWFVYFYSWFQGFDNISRFFIMFFPITAIFAGHGILFLTSLLGEGFKTRKIVFAIITVTLAVMFIPYSFGRDEPNVYTQITCGNQTIVSTWSELVELKVSSKFNYDHLVLGTKIPELAEQDIPHNCAVVSAWNDVLGATTDLTVYELEDFMDSSFREEVFNKHSCVLLFEGNLCFDYGYDVFDSIKEDYNLSVYKSYSEGNLTFRFYRLYER